MEYAAIGVVAGVIITCSFIGNSLSNWLFNSDDSAKLNSVIQNDIRIKEEIHQNNIYDIIVIVLATVVIVLGVIVVVIKYWKTYRRGNDIEMQVIDNIAKQSRRNSDESESIDNN